MVAAAAGAMAHVCMHATGKLRCSALATVYTSRYQKLAVPPADLDLSHAKPSGRMRYDEGTGLILFVDRQQVQAFSPGTPMQRPLWVSNTRQVCAMSTEIN